MVDKKLCYVIMPFGNTKLCTEAEWTEVFANVIKPAVEGAGLNYECRRSEATTGNLIKAIVSSLYEASVIIADLTDRNANVFYELGVRHAFRNRTILIAQRRQHIPSDLVGYASHVYRWKTSQEKKDFAKRIRLLLKKLETDINRPDNPVADFLADRSRSILQFEDRTNERMLQAVIAENNVMQRMLTGLLSQLPQDKRSPRMSLPSPALDHLIATQYVNNQQFAEQAIRVRAMLVFTDMENLNTNMLDQLTKFIKRFGECAQLVSQAQKSGNSIERLALPELTWPE